MHRNACADAHASFVIPFEVSFTILDVASAFALVVIPVVRVVEALLSSTLEVADVRVESHNDSIDSVRCLELAQTTSSLLIEIEAVIALLAVNESASNHVPNLTIGSGSAWGIAAANSRRWVEEVRHAINVWAWNVFVLARACVSVELVSAGANLSQTLAVVGLDAVVEADWALAVFWQAVANSGVPVVAVLARAIWRAQTIAGVSIEVVVASARSFWVFNALARLTLYIVDRVRSHI